MSPESKHADNPYSVYNDDDESDGYDTDVGAKGDGYYKHNRDDQDWISVDYQQALIEYHSRKVVQFNSLAALTITYNNEACPRKIDEESRVCIDQQEAQEFRDYYVLD